LIAGFITLKYIASSNWVFNDLLAMSFSIYFINQMIVSSFLNGTVYLMGMLMYDIFWVFCSDVMITVAKELTLPIKLIFPSNPNGINVTYYILGIGDIILPAVFISLMLRYDFL
jgi:minor histocompatibility antigen H13